MLAIGIAVMLVASFTLLPAVLALLGPRAFWPGRAEPGRSTRWERVAGLVRRRSGWLIAGILAFLAVAALGNLVHTGSIGFGQGFTRATDATEGTNILDVKFPPAELAAFVVAPRGRTDRGRRRGRRPDRGGAGRARAAAAGVGRRPRRRAAPRRSGLAGGERRDPDADLRTALRGPVPGALVGGITAENVDVQAANADDTRLIVPVTLLVRPLVLMLLLRAWSRRSS